MAKMPCLFPGGGRGKDFKERKSYRYQGLDNRNSFKRCSVTTGRLHDVHVEANLREIPCVVYECRSDLFVTTVSSNILSLIGIQPEAILGNSTLWNERFLEEDRRRLQKRLDQMIDSDVAIETHRIENDRGLRIWVAHSLQVVRTERKFDIHGCIVPLTPDFQAKFMESSTVSQFVHKIGNHFQLIDLLLGSLRRGHPNSDEIAALQNTVDRAVEFVRSFSNFTQPVTCHDRIGLAETLKSLEGCTGNLVDITVDPSLRSATVKGDEFLLEFALTAVLRNAAEATEKHGAVVLHACQEQFAEEARAMALIAIRDGGHGIESRSIAELAEPFFSTRQNRDGLGLSSAVRIFEMHGGGLKIFSTKDGGTEVRIFLPIESDNDQLR